MNSRRRDYYTIIGRGLKLTADSRVALVSRGEMLMLMVHGEAGGAITGGLEYTLGAKEDGPIKADSNLVMTVITAE